MTRQTKLRTDAIKPNENISFPIGTVLAVRKYYERLGLSEIIGRFKKRGVNISSLVQALLSYRLSENQSITKASEWITRDEVLKVFGIQSFEQRTLYRVLEIIGENREEIMLDIQDVLFDTYDFEHTNINMDWTSLILFGEKCPIGKRGYSRDHRPDKKQITVGVSELAAPINVPIGMTVREGNVNDQVHFTDTFNQVKDKLEKGSIVVFDQGANRKANLDRVSRAKMKYLTLRHINTSDEENRIKNFDKAKAELIDAENGVYGIKYRKPSKYNYFFYSEKLRGEQVEAKLRKVERLFEEAQFLQDCIDRDRELPKRYRINNPLVECKYYYQTKLKTMNEEAAKEILRKASITGKEGFFCLVSNMNLTLSEAITIYRQKDSIEKLFNSLKNEIEIRPIRVWSDISVYGATIIVFLAQLFVSLIRFEHETLKHVSTKFIKVSLMNLTVTVEFGKRSSKRLIFSNFDPISQEILMENRVFA